MSRTHDLTSYPRRLAFLNHDFLSCLAYSVLIHMGVLSPGDLVECKPKLMSSTSRTKRNGLRLPERALPNSSKTVWCSA